MTVINPSMTVEQGIGLRGRHYEGQHAEANGISPNAGDTFFAWDTGYGLREKDDVWVVATRGNTVPHLLNRSTTFMTETD